MTIATKLHILLITTILGVGLYMFLLYKEIKMFERELADIRIKVQSVASQLPPATGGNGGLVVDVVGTSCPMRGANIADAISAACPDIAVIADNGDDASENMSVTSNEIKEILTNIQDMPDAADMPDVDLPITTSAAAAAAVAAATAASAPAPPAAPTKPTAPPKPTVDLDNWSSLSDEEVANLKYDDLRAIVRKSGMNGRGTKQELLGMVLSMKKDASRTPAPTSTSTDADATSAPAATSATEVATA